MPFKEYSQACTSKYQTHNSKLQKLEKKKTERKEQVRRLQNRIDKLYENSPWWVDELIQPLAKEIAEDTGAIEYEVYGPHGLGATVSIQLTYENEVEKFIEIRPGNFDEGHFYIVNLSENTERYPSGTLGEINGLNHPTVKIPEDATTEWIMQYAVCD